MADLRTCRICGNEIILYNPSPSREKRSIPPDMCLACGYSHTECLDGDDEEREHLELYESGIHFGKHLYHGGK